MAAPTLSRPFVLLDNRVMYQEYADWRMVVCECESWVAYGCGPLGQQIVEGLTLLAGLGSGDDDEDHVPCLAVHALDEVLHGFEEEVPGELERIYGCRERADRMVEAYGTRVRSYYLLYERDAASLSLLPYEPTNCRTVYTTSPLLVRRHGGSGYSLVLTAVTGDPPGRPVVYSWTPSLNDDGAGGLGPWRIRQRRHATAMPDTFDAEWTFTCKGKAFWANPTQGVLYCECADLLGDGAGAVEFTFVALPEKYMIEDMLDRREEYCHRAMGIGVGDSVWFVILESCEHPGDTTLVVLSLDLSDCAGEPRWERHMELSLLSIWALEGFVKAGLPRRVPRAPFLREQDAGIIYLFLPPADEKAERGCYLIGIDVRDRSEPRLLPPRRLAMVPWLNDQPDILSPEFFDRRKCNQDESLSQLSTQPA
ncbi:unnamed protein product [Alopecurus aequalis]